MTVTTPITIIDRAAARARSQATLSGIDRVAERVGVSLVRWSHTRAARNELSHDENLREVQMLESQVQREIVAQRLTHLGI